MACKKVCDCNLTIDNTGIGCTPLMKVEKRPWIVNKTKSDGTLCFIDLTDTFDDAYFTDWINEADPLDRLYPLPEVKDITDQREAPVTFSWKDGTQVFVRDGVRKFQGMFPPDSASPQLTGILEGQRCAKPCKFSVDADGTIWGRISEDGTKLYPIEMDAQSVAAIFTKPTDTEPQMLGWTFNYAPAEKDCNLRGIPTTELDDASINPLDYNGLMDVYAKVIACTTTKLTVKLYNIFGTAINPQTIQNLLVANFALYNVTDSSAIALTGTGAAFAETTGTYELTYATANAPTSADVLRLTPTKDGYDFAPVVATSIVVS